LSEKSDILQLSDEDLLFSYKESGKSIYVRELYSRYIPLLYGVCLKYLKDAGSAQNAVMRLFDDLLYKIADYDIDVFQSWIYSTAKKYCLQLLGKEDNFISADIDGNSAEETGEAEEIEGAKETTETEDADEVNDPFLQDATDGYGQLSGRPDSHLKKIKEYVTKRTKNDSHYLQLWSIVACVAIIIFLSVIFFAYNYNTDNDKTIFTERTTYVENPVNNTDALSNNIKSSDVKAIKPKEDFLEKKEKTIVQQEKKKIPEENQPIDWNRPIEEDQTTGGNQPLEEERTNIWNQIIEKYQTANWDQPIDEHNNYSLSNSDIQALLSEHHPTEPKTLNNSDQTSGTVTVDGEKAFSNYIEKNRKQIGNNVCGNQHGKVILLFKVNEKGRPVDIAVLRSLCPAADRTAVQLLQNGPGWAASNDFTRMEIAF